MTARMRKRHPGAHLLQSVFWLSLSCLGFGSITHCGTGPVVGGECRPGLAACGQSCVNLGSDANNCGACGRRCSAFEQCLVGVCLDPDSPAVTGRPVDGGVLLPDGGLLLPDGTVTDPDGASGNGGAGGSAGNGDGNGGAAGRNANGGSGGFGNVCSEPFNTPEACGDCATRCQNPRPFCAAADEGFECVAACDVDLVSCEGRCVDTTTDIDHCGGCNRHCPTAVCRDSVCVGGLAGHVVSMCMSLETYRFDAPQNALLANAIFLAPNDPVRVLAYTRYATALGVTGVQRAVAEADVDNAREIQLDIVTSSAGVADDLLAGSHDVLLVYDQALAPSGSLAALGAEWRDMLATFTARGGVVITLASNSGIREMFDFIGESGLLPELTGQTSATGELLYNRAPADAVGLNVFGEFRALRSSCTFEIPAAPDSGTTFVVTDSPQGSGDLGNPSVVHRVTTSE